MRIRVVLIGLFKAGRDKQQNLDCPEGSLVRDLVVDLQLPQQHLGIILINGVHANLESPLHDGDELTLLPFVDGG